MIVDAVILAGGRSARLGGASKAALIYADQSLLAHTIDTAARAARSIVVVAPEQTAVPPYVTVVREDPPFSGPAAAIAAGVGIGATAGARSDYTLVLACDMPNVERAVGVLIAALDDASAWDGVIAIDHRRHRQPLAAVYETTRLELAVSDNERRNGLAGLSVFRLVAGLRLQEVAVPRSSTDDVDTPEDAARFGILLPSVSQKEETP